MEKVTITKIFTKDRVSQAGKPFTSLSILTEEYGEKWISGFKNEQTKNWREGDIVDIKITQKGEYLNFEPVMFEEKSDNFMAKINHELMGLRLQVGKIESILMIPGMSDKIEQHAKAYLEQKGYVIPSVKNEIKNDEEKIDINDIPF